MKKSLWIGMAVVWVLGVAGGSWVSSVSAAEIELKLAHFMPTMHVQHREAFEPFCQRVAELTDGKVAIKIYPGATLGNPKTMVDAIQTGITDIGFVLPEYIPGRFPRSSVFEMPYIFNSAAHVTQVVYDIYKEYLAEDYKDFKVLWFLSAPLTQLHTVDEAVTSVEDFKGRKIRSGSATETEGLKRLGANPIGMPISEISIALQKGVVDGVFTPYAALKSHKLIDVVKHMTEINYNGALMCVLMKKSKWDKLPDYAKNAMDQVADREFGIKAAEAFDKEDQENIEAAKAKGIQIHMLSEADKAEIRDRISGIWGKWVEEKTKKGIPAREILDATLKAAKTQP